MASLYAVSSTSTLSQFRWMEHWWWGPGLSFGVGAARKFGSLSTATASKRRRERLQTSVCCCFILTPKHLYKILHDTEFSWGKKEESVNTEDQLEPSGLQLLFQETENFRALGISMEHFAQTTNTPNYAACVWLWALTTSEEVRAALPPLTLLS